MSIQYGTYKREGVFVFLGPFRDTAEDAIAFCCEENLRLGHEAWDIYTVDAPFTPNTGQWIHSPAPVDFIRRTPKGWSVLPGSDEAEDCLDDCAP